MISTKQVFTAIKSSGISWEKSEKLIQELAWRDYWQQVWIAKGDEIHKDLKHPQSPVRNYKMPKAITTAQTGINAVDEAIQELYASGYMHNHMRMYVAALCCNIAQCHWRESAKWLYAHLLDGDLASNQLSWQWVSGANASKKYYANQNNINKYWGSNQKNTFLDVDYADFPEMDVPAVLQPSINLEIKPRLLKEPIPKLDSNQITAVYNYYNLDCDWLTGSEYQRVLLIEPSIFERFPITQKCIDFMMELANNISNIHIFIGEFCELEKYIDSRKISYKEHPLNTHYSGNVYPREWLSDVEGYYRSFFGFWKQCKKQIKW
ncbi:deoxyribodipyrimidine photolyase [Flavobacteriales bacterium]|nr:deoxyribodipyrimidine photolyase [Flavobacteriales bacterium]